LLLSSNPNGPGKTGGRRFALEEAIGENIRARGLTGASFGDNVLSQSDPTDDVLAAIASIMEQPQTELESESPFVEQETSTPDLDDGEGYSKLGPGPMAAMRFKWTVRREGNHDYFVDETVGSGSKPIVSGPMSKEEAIQLVDEHADEARRRFDQIKDEMTGRQEDQ
jgi:hypothetical protein